MTLRTFYPDILPFRSRHLTVSHGHVLHLEEFGNHGGLPVVFLHGGPGGGTEPWHARFFDPKRYHIILFDQRGCGRSTPSADLRHNTTRDLIEDLECIRETLNLDRWLLFGGSWGSTLALAYAQTFPERVLGLVLRGVFLCRDEDIDWFYRQGASRLFPDYWADFLKPLDAEGRRDPVKGYRLLLNGENDIAMMQAAMAWSLWEARTATLLPNPAIEKHFQDPVTALAMARIENHYFSHHAFLEPGQLLRDAGRLDKIPGIIVHGRYDVICPIDQAVALKQAWPQVELNIVSNAGHSAAEPGIVDALIRATDAMADRLHSVS